MQQRSSPSPSPRLALLGRGGGSRGKGITTPVTRASKRVGPEGNTAIATGAAAGEVSGAIFLFFCQRRE